ncbi:hypothetical protein C9374_014365 [Naegleria lovaniensis]|uniref:RING-type domain-containing protein n=1 Tax=Naegleria lovaniensis TaxID=51637 RepID=A0AA88GXR1_NAELO|nr:uncharacterized protein C9374_014365 [Naegleria lovaniensis]KAG2388965.1 hypothetical protein C9374_014365 [Naegleria lovaniensis]
MSSPQRSHHQGRFTSSGVVAAGSMEQYTGSSISSTTSKNHHGGRRKNSKGYTPSGKIQEGEERVIFHDELYNNHDNHGGSKNFREYIPSEEIILSTSRSDDDEEEDEDEQLHENNHHHQHGENPTNHYSSSPLKSTLEATNGIPIMASSASTHHHQSRRGFTSSSYEKKKRNKAFQQHVVMSGYGSSSSGGAFSSSTGSPPTSSNDSPHEEEEYFRSNDVYDYRGHAFKLTGATGIAAGNVSVGNNTNRNRASSSGSHHSASNNHNNGHNRHHRHKHHHHHHYNDYYARPKTKEEYVLANFHFVLRPLAEPTKDVNDTTNQFYANEYNQGRVDADTLVDWDTIELVIKQTHDPNQEQCPICLEVLKAPKITKCGHVFCYACILRYVAMGEKTYRKCPLCNESVYIDALRSVQIDVKPKYKEHDKMNFVLLKRDKKVIIPDLLDDLDTCLGGIQSHSLPTVYPVYGDHNSSKFCRFNVTYDISSIIKKELSDLDSSLKEAESGDETQFIKLAKEQVLQRQKSFQDWITKNVPKGRPKGSSHSPRKASKQAASSSIITHTTIDENKKKSELDPDNYWYYQSEDNQMMFLHPLCTKILLHEYDGDFTKFPHRLSDCEIIELETVELDEEFRKRYPILKHVPCGCYISLVEVDMKNFASHDTIANFYKDLKHRKNRREDKIRKQIEEEEEEKRREESRKEEERLAREKLLQELHISNFPELTSDMTPPPVNDIHFPSPSAASAILANDKSQKRKPVKLNDWTKRQQQQNLKASTSSQENATARLQGDWAAKSKPSTSNASHSSSSSKKDKEFPSLGSGKKKK